MDVMKREPIQNVIVEIKQVLAEARARVVAQVNTQVDVSTF